MSNDFELPSKASLKTSVKPVVQKKPVAEVVVEAPERAETVTNTDVPGTQPKYDPAELLKIFDDIIFAGEYIEEIVIKGRLPVKFSTRTAQQIGQIQDALDMAKLTLISSVEQRRLILSLEQALVNFNGKDLTGLSSKERSAFVGNLAAPVIAMLLDEMSKFDMKIAAACREEANF